MKFKKFGKLPGKPSALLELAMKDLAKVERSQRYIVDMVEWHSPILNNQCAVCLAGAVMANSLDIPPDHDITPDCFYQEEHALCAIDEFRCGNISRGFKFLGISGGLEFNRTMPRYGNREFKPAMKQLIKDLKKGGY